MDLRVGASYPWIRRGAGDRQMGISGVHLDGVAPERIVSTEQFDDPWHPGEAVGPLVLLKEDGALGTTAIEHLPLGLGFALLRPTRSRSSSGASAFPGPAR